MIRSIQAILLLLVVGIFMCTLPFKSFGEERIPKLDDLTKKMKVNEILLWQVNERINKVKYVPDTINYGVSDYWAAPEEFYRKGGDCEDYAIAKMSALHGYGIPLRELKMVLVTTKDGREHAMLSVRLNKKVYLLDNLNNNIHPLDYLKDYSLSMVIKFYDLK